ncbi:MFS general substrate transporter [Microthyrium microscopicum]|uniref:MFS general substrate transporter n=1 Tax=Microthyrium microscopicum TaxID=703497 RepID=A0A6A6UCI4_9PEZI|nr:MFS general substrate transporter [Microthyrium microscopicum]
MDDKIPRNHIIVMIALCIAIFLVSLDTVIITTALPSIAADFNISDSGYAWVGSAYLLTNCCGIPAWGTFSNVFGRKPVLLLANAFFLAGSIMSATSRNLGMLIAGRAIQGLGGGGIGVSVNICVSDLFAERLRGLMLGIIGGVWAISSALGPVLGGILTQQLNWRWCFWINLPIDALVVLLIITCLRIHNTPTPFWNGIIGIDWLGAITIAGATVMFLLGLQFGGVTYPWSSATVVCLLLFGILTFILFFVAQARVSASPIMPFHIFSNRSNLSALTVTFFDGFVFNSVAYFLPLYYQSVLDSSPTRSGVLMLPLAVPLALFSASAGWIMQRTGRFLELLRGGLLLMTLGTGLLVDLPAHMDLARLIPFLIIIGIGFGPNFHAPLLALQKNLQEKDIAAGTATFGFIRMLSGALGIALCQVAFQSGIGDQRKRLASLGLPDKYLDLLTSGATISGSHNADATNTEALAWVRQAKTSAMSWVWVLCCVASCLGLLASLMIQKSRLNEGRVKDEQDSVEMAHTKSSSTDENHLIGARAVASAVV